MLRRFEPGAFKMVKKSIKLLYVWSRFEPASFQVEFQDATSYYTEDNITNSSNTSSLIKTYATAFLTRPAFISLSATQS